MKVQITDDAKFPAPINRLSDAMADRPWLDALTSITGIETLLADPDLAGGGMHVTSPGGRIELWDQQVSQCVQSLAPVLNRCIVFETSERSFHGVTPVRSPHPTFKSAIGITDRKA